jgi:hypothetical protein
VHDCWWLVITNNGWIYFLTAIEIASEIVRLEPTINKNRARYLTMFGSQKRFDWITCGWWCLIWSFSWLEVHVIVLISDNKGYSETFFSVRECTSREERIMCPGWVNRNHFMIIYLKTSVTSYQYVGKIPSGKGYNLSP